MKNRGQAVISCRGVGRWAMIGLDDGLRNDSLARKRVPGICPRCRNIALGNPLNRLRQEQVQEKTGNVRHFRTFIRRCTRSGRRCLRSFPPGRRGGGVLSAAPSPDRSGGRLPCADSCPFFPPPRAAPRPNLFTFRLQLDDNFAGERCDIRGGIGGDPGCERALRITRPRPQK